MQSARFIGCLGRLPHDPLALATSPRHVFGALRPPPSLDRTAIPFSPLLWDNDTLPDCTAVAIGNAGRAVAALQGFTLPVGQDAARDFYAKTLQCSSDYVTLAATEGTQIITALQALAGPGGFPLLFGELTGLSGVVDCTSVTEMALAIDRFGHLNLGVDLFEADMTPGSVEWGLPAGRPSGALIGGHSILAFDYTGLAPRDHLRLASWGQWYWATWEWVLSRVREAHAMIFRQLAGPDGIFWNGLSADDLVEHLNG